jgi:putative DNA primase/helicase
MTTDASSQTRRTATTTPTGAPPAAALDELAFRSANLVEAALAWWQAGCSVVPVRTNGSKVPVGDGWVQYQHQRATRERVAAWFSGGHPGIGVVCGAVSGHLEMFEFEGLAVHEGLVERLRDHLTATGHTALWHTIINGYVERSPSGGLHVMVRVTGGVDRNTKLAQREARDEELTADERTLLHDKGIRARRVLIETRGEGGFVVVAPSQGWVHDSGQPWRALTGTPATIPTLTAAQRNTLHLAARCLDQVPPPAPIPDPAPDRSRGPGNAVRPGDDFNHRAQWADILSAHGWEAERVEANRTYWRRPGKDHGISAVTGGDRGDFMWVFSTSTELPNDHAMSKFRVYALLQHGGDFAAAARALHNAGYGHSGADPRPPRRRRPATADPAGPAGAADNPAAGTPITPPLGNDAA